jgi:hypothetical protein
MLFMSLWRIRPGQRDEAIHRFAKTGGVPPAGVKLLGRWSDVSASSGCNIFECDDASLVAQAALEWNDIMEITTAPALTDEQLAKVLSGIKRD